MKIREIAFIEQMEHSECGLACVSMILNAFRQNKRLNELRNTYGVPVGGNTLYQLSYILDRYNIKNKGLRCKLNSNFYRDLKKLLNDNVLIALWNDNHYVIVEKVARKKVIIIDPASQKKKISMEEFINHFSFVALKIPRNQDVIKQKKSTKNPIVKTLLLDNKIKILFAIIFSFFVQVSSIIISIISKNVIDSKKTIELQSLMLIVTVLFLVYFIVQLTQKIITTKLQFAISKSLSHKTISKILSVPMSFFINRSQGELVFRVNSTETLRQLLTETVITLILNAFFSIMYFIIMLRFSKVLSLFTLVLTLILLILYTINSKITYIFNQRSLVANTKNQNIINEIISSIETIKTTGVEEDRLDKWRKNYKKIMDVEYRKNIYNSFIMAFPIIVIEMYTLFIVIGGMYFINNNTITLGTIVAFSTIGLSFITPICSLASTYNTILSIKIYLSKLQDIFDTDDEQNEKIQDFILKDGSIIIENLTFGYDFFSKPVLNIDNLKIESGQKVAIVGESGSGKSTLLKILGTILHYKEGKIKVGGEDLKAVDYVSYRKQIGYVTQNPILKNGSILENITLGKEYNKEDVEKSIENSGLKTLIQKIPLGVNANISEFGKNMSGGEKQRISLARTFIKKSKIILLDEPTSSLDKISEREVLKGVFKLNSTVLMVCHRMTDIEKFDKVIFLENGKIVDSGKHNDLLSNSLNYRRYFLDI